MLLAPLYRLHLGDVVGPSSLRVILSQYCAQFYLTVLFLINFTLLTISIVLQYLPEDLFWGLEILVTVLITHFGVLITAPYVTVAFAVISNTVLSRCLDLCYGDISAQFILKNDLCRVVLLNDHNICAKLAAKPFTETKNFTCFVEQ